MTLQQVRTADQHLAGARPAPDLVLLVDQTSELEGRKQGPPRGAQTALDQRVLLAGQTSDRREQPLIDRCCWSIKHESSLLHVHLAAGPPWQQAAAIDHPVHSGSHHSTS
jgi:hypothetical protein